MAYIEMTIESIRVGLMNPQLTRLNSQYVVMLKEKEAERYLPIFIGSAEANAIAIKLRGETLPRPLTHDFAIAIIRTLGGRIRSAVINKLEDDCFRANLIVMTGKKEKEIDCRPSDAMAVAVRARVPIFAEDRVLKKAAIVLDSDPESDSIVDERDKKTHQINGFSTVAQDILNRAEEEAKSGAQDCVTTGHVLLALTRQTNRATEVLKSLGVDLDQVQQKIEAVLREHPDIEGEGTGLTHLVKNTTVLSIQEAKRLGKEKVEPEHILIGLVRQNDGVAGSLLNALEITPEKIYIELIHIYTRPMY